MQAQPIHETGIEIWLRLRVLNNSGYKAVLIQLHKLPFMNEALGQTTLTTTDHQWTIFVKEHMSDIQEAVFALQNEPCDGEC